jgi:hypothetical protein
MAHLDAMDQFGFDHVGQKTSGCAIAGLISLGAVDSAKPDVNDFAFQIHIEGVAVGDRNHASEEVVIGARSVERKEKK